MTSAASRSRCAVRNGRNVGEPISSSPSTNTVTPTREVVAEHAQRADVRDDPGLVVGRAAAVQAPVALGRARTGGVPVGVVAGRLDVVVRVEQDRRGSRRGRAAADDGRAPARPSTPVRRTWTSSRPAPRSSAGDGVGARGDVRLVELGVRDARDPHERLEVGAQGAEERAARSRSARAPRSGRERGAAVRGCVVGHASRHATRLPWTSCSDAATTRSPPSRRRRPAEPVGDGKGRPTPKRKDAEAANKRPLVPHRPQGRGEDRAGRQPQGAARPRVPGDADRRRALHAAQGPRAGQRRYMRDDVDARWNLGEFFLPVAVVLIVRPARVQQNAAVAGGVDPRALRVHRRCSRRRRVHPVARRSRSA